MFFAIKFEIIKITMNELSKNLFCTGAASSDGETIVPEMGELSEFHPDQLSNLEDIQEALNKLVGAELHDDTDMSMSTVDDVDVVDHEVTIGQDQEDMDISTLPDIPDMENRHQEITDMLEDNLEIGQTITIEAPPVPVEKKMVPIKPAMTVPVSFPQLKTIRPLPEALKGKRPGSFNLTSVKKSVSVIYAYKSTFVLFLNAFLTLYRRDFNFF